MLDPRARAWILVSTLSAWLALTGVHAAQDAAPDALALYRELAPSALAGALEPGAAPRLLAAARELIQRAPEGLEPDEVFRAALAAAELVDARNELSALRSYATYLRAQGERARVAALLEPRLARLVEREPADGNGVLLAFLLVQVLREENRWPDALALIDATLPRVLAADDRANVESMLYGERANVYLAWGLPDLARRWQARQRASLHDAPDNARRHADLLEANLLLAEMDDAVRAAEVERRLSEMLADERLYPRNALQRGRLLVRTALARIELARKEHARIADARAALEQALAIETLEPYERARGELAFAEVHLLADERDEAALALERARGEGTPPPDLDAIAATLRAVLARRGGTDAERERARAELERAALAFLDAWARLPPREGGFGFLLFRENRRVFGELVDLTLATGSSGATGAADGAERALALVLRAQALSSLARSIAKASALSDAPPTLAELRAELCPPGDGLLVLLPCPEKSFLFALDRERLACFPLAPMETLRAAEEDVLLRTLRATSIPAAERAEHERALAQALAAASDALLPVGARELVRGWSHATLVGAELLPSFAYEDLPLDATGDGERTLGASCALAYASSLPTLLALARRADAAPPRSTDVWFVGCPRPPARADEQAPELATLPFDEHDARALLAPYDGQKRVLVGASARPSVLAEPELARARVLQLVAHGGRDDDDERPALLFLSGEDAAHGDVRARDVERGAAPELVILMACAAARAPSREGDAGAADLGGAFQRAGASAVLLSPLPLEFHATWRLMEAFHRELAGGAAPSDALQRARAELRADARFAGEPSAALVHLEGLAHRPLFAPRPARGRGALALLALVPLAAIALGWRARRRAPQGYGS